MSDPKELPTLAVLTLTSGVMLVEGMEAVYEAADQIMGHPVWTHELAALQQDMQDRVTEQYPGFPTSKRWNEHFVAFGQRVVDAFGANLVIRRGDAVRERGPEETLKVALDKGTRAARP